MQQQHDMQVEDIELNTMIKNQIMHAIMSLHTLVFRIITFIIPNIFLICLFKLRNLLKTR